MTIGYGDLSSVSMIAKIGSSPLISQKKQMNTAVYFPAPNLAEVWRKSLKYKMLWFLLKPYQVWSKIVHVPGQRGLYTEPFRDVLKGQITETFMN